MLLSGVQLPSDTIVVISHVLQIKESHLVRVEGHIDSRLNRPDNNVLHDFIDKLMASKTSLEKPHLPTTGARHFGIRNIGSLVPIFMCRSLVLGTWSVGSNTTR